MKKTLKQQIAEYKEISGQFAVTRKDFDEKQRELESKLVELSARLHQRQNDTVLDISAEALTEDHAIKSEIAETESMLSAVKERHQKLVNPVKMNEFRSVVFSNAITEAAQEYNEKLPALLDEIQAAKQHYLNKLVEYHALKSSVNQKIIDVGREVDREPQQSDFPNVREINWHYDAHPHADGAKYTVEKYEVDSAVNLGKLQY